MVEKRLVVASLVVVLLKLFSTTFVVLPDSYTYLSLARYMPLGDLTYALFTIVISPIAKLDLTLEYITFLVKFFLVLVTTTTLYPLYHFFRRYMKEGEALLLAMAFQFFPPLFFSNFIMRDAVANSLIVWSIYFLTLNRPILSLVLAFFSVVFKLTSTPYLFALIFVLIVKRFGLLPTLALLAVLGSVAGIVFYFDYVEGDISIIKSIPLPNAYFFLGALLYPIIASFGLALRKEDELIHISAIAYILSIIFMAIFLVLLTNQYGDNFFESYRFYGRYLESSIIPLYMLSFTVFPSARNFLLFFLASLLFSIFIPPDVSANPINLLTYPFSNHLLMVVSLFLYFSALRSGDSIFLRLIPAFLIIGMFASYPILEELPRVSFSDWRSAPLIEEYGLFDPNPKLEQNSEVFVGFAYRRFAINGTYSVKSLCSWVRPKIKIGNEEPFVILEKREISAAGELVVYPVPPLLCGPFIDSLMWVGPSLEGG